ncbi:MAG: hypothetical protein IJI22_04415 [Bacilli bacterium]|nr:hypothetical protein [Bacilli bacterium]
MNIKGGMIALVLFKYEEEIIPKSYEVLKEIEDGIVSEKNWNDANSQKYLSRLEDCAEVVQLRNTLNDLASNLDPELSISWEFLARCLSKKGFNSGLIEIVHAFFELAFNSYEEIKKSISENVFFDSRYNVYVYPISGACIGDLEIKDYLKDNWKDALTDNEYYASLIAKGCELELGPNFIYPFNLFKGSVYCSNYEEMFEAGVLDEDNTMQDTLGKTK